LSWREEIDIVLQEWIAALGGHQGRQRWQRVGTARPTGEPGVYVVDIRASDLTADQTDNLRLAGPDGAGVQAGFPVMEATIDGELIRLRVAEFAAPAHPYLWRQRQQPTFLVTALREGLSSLADAGLASLLARGEVGGRARGRHAAARAATSAGERLPRLPGHRTVASVGPARHGENQGAAVRRRRSQYSSAIRAIRSSRRSTSPKPSPLCVPWSPMW
jgi:hypothetical protein